MLLRHIPLTDLRFIGYAIGGKHPTALLSREAGRLQFRLSSNERRLESVGNNAGRERIKGHQVLSHVKSATY